MHAMMMELVNFQRHEFELFPGRCLYVSICGGLSADMISRLLETYLPKQAGKRKLDEAGGGSVEEKQLEASMKKIHLS